jgi:hypothetical protein
MYQVIDNFLSSTDFKFVQGNLLDPSWPWYFIDSVVSWDERDDITRFQFVYSMYQQNTWQQAGEAIVSRFLPYFKPLTVVRVKANLTTRTEQIIEQAAHVDFLTPDSKTYDFMRTAIFYVNSNDGYTQFVDGPRVESVANRVVIFNSGQKHFGTTCTNQSRRIVINFNYIPEEIS